MRDDTESDFCDRMPGQHTGRLSLELQASEAAEWQEILDMLATRVRNLENEVVKLKASAAAGESAPISPEVPQAHGLTTPTTPSAAACASEPVAGDSSLEKDAARYRWLRAQHWNDSRLCVVEFPKKSVKLGSVCPSKEQLDDAVDYYMIPAANLPPVYDSPPATPSAAVGASESGAGDTVPPEVGKRYVCRNGEVTEAMGDGLRKSYPFRAVVNCVYRTWRRDGRHDESKISVYDLIAEYHEPEPSPPVESPDDWVMLREPEHVIRECDWLNHRTSDRWNKCSMTAGYKIHNYPDYNFRCRRKDLPLVPADKPRMRQVTLREYRNTGESTAWSSSDWLIEARLTGRTAVAEVPE